MAYYDVRSCINGYKVLSEDWMCGTVLMEIGKIYGRNDCGDDDVLKFYLNANDCFKHSKFDSNNRVVEVVALSTVNKLSKRNTCCIADRLHVVREISWDELFKIVNDGVGCTGRGNVGDFNSGYFNVGSFNSGNYNKGDCNSKDKNVGDCNCGFYNVGDYNSGFYNLGNLNSGNNNMGDGNSGCGNIGKYNSGYFNVGDFNVGDYNVGDYNHGIFNTEDVKMYLFNKPSDWELEDWMLSEARSILKGMPPLTVEWIDAKEVLGGEEITDTNYRVTGGCLRVVRDSSVRQRWWDLLKDFEREEIMDMPNFDADIFERITGIKIQGSE